MKQAENIWKMLDNMSENNPEVILFFKYQDYKKFIEKNVKEGFKDIKKKKEEDDVKR